MSPDFKPPIFIDRDLLLETLNLLTAASYPLILDGDLRTKINPRKVFDALHALAYPAPVPTPAPVPMKPGVFYAADPDALKPWTEDEKNQLYSMLDEDNPFCYLVIDKDGNTVHSANWEAACHEHIRDAMEHAPEEAAEWVVRPAFLSPVMLGKPLAWMTREGNVISDRQKRTFTSTNNAYPDHVIPLYGARKRFPQEKASDDKL